MLGAAVQFKEIFPKYGDIDSSLECVLSIDVWSQVENVRQLLAIFNEVTNIVFGIDYPTTNIYLYELWRMEDILGKKSRDENDYMKSMVKKWVLRLKDILGTWGRGGGGLVSNYNGIRPDLR